LGQLFLLCVAERGGELKPQDLVPLLQWLEKQRYGMLRTNIDAGQRGELKRWATALEKEHRDWFAARNAYDFNGDEQADMCNRGDDADEDMFLTISARHRA
jgi:hypothetical protein